MGKSNKTRKSMQNLSLEKLFDSDKRLRVIKFFVRNNAESYSIKEISKILKLTFVHAKNHISKLKEMGFLKSKRGAKGEMFYTNMAFHLYSDLRSLVIKLTPFTSSSLVRRAEKLGRVKLFIVSGVFLNQENSKVDILIAGDSLNTRKVKFFLADLEAQVGKEINYASMNAEEFKYRMNMYDRFVRDILDHPHQILINKLKI